MDANDTKKVIDKLIEQDGLFDLLRFSYMPEGQDARVLIQRSVEQAGKYSQYMALCQEHSGEDLEPLSQSEIKSLMDSSTGEGDTSVSKLTVAESSASEVQTPSGHTRQIPRTSKDIIVYDTEWGNVYCTPQKTDALRIPTDLALDMRADLSGEQLGELLKSIIDYHLATELGDTYIPNIEDSNIRSYFREWKRFYEKDCKSFYLKCLRNRINASHRKGQIPFEIPYAE